MSDITEFDTFMDDEENEIDVCACEECACPNPVDDENDICDLCQRGNHF